MKRLFLTFSTALLLAATAQAQSPEAFKYQAVVRDAGNTIVHIHIGDILDSEIDEITAIEQNPNKQIQLLTQKIDDSILQSYKLWPTNYIAYDILHNSNQFEKNYTLEEKQLFQRRLELRIDDNSIVLKEGFLAMYANPVVNKLKYNNATV